MGNDKSLADTWLAGFRTKLQAVAMHRDNGTGHNRRGVFIFGRLEMIAHGQWRDAE